MTNRFIYQEIILRKGIYREAITLTQNGWHVMANHIPGFHPPPEIEGYMPHIYAVKDDKTYIIDFMIEGSTGDEMFLAHTNYANYDESTNYLCLLVDASGFRMDEVN